jgi:hypothetical protein
VLAGWLTEDGAVKLACEGFSLCRVEDVAHWSIARIGVRQQSKCVFEEHAVLRCAGVMVMMMIMLGGGGGGGV